MAAGLVCYKNGILGRKITFFDIYKNWPCIEWRDDNPLTEILEIISECEVAVAGKNLRSWLHEIERGENPATRKDEPASLNILATGDHLELMQWISHRG